MEAMAASVSASANDHYSTYSVTAAAVHAL